ncbi:hypothetical protein Q361_10841 [Flavobacterium croceum DSM 17960]|uniref:Uncharacterized protein n=1 Tax=Flavobacterium croceum DSM 17960 TaxID=1121886 RepID=A0A2S4N7P3_9FLAO|nr:hypothetical protein Q361_10841 [Flavobacterium croceum DSM 17960]
MKNIINFFKSGSPFLILAIAVAIIVVSKIIELKFKDIAMLFQIIGFILILFGLKKLLNAKFRK